MEPITVLLLLLIVCGIMLVLFSFFMFSSETKADKSNNFDTENTLKAIELSVNEMDKIMDEFEKTSKIIFAEIDERYQELLFLYALIDGKKTELSEINKGTTVKNISTPPIKTIKNPRYTELETLQRQGLPIAEIAKQTHMGQGEVKLILELGKVR